jgi:adenosylcobinamide-GDP ribazoletransferase
VTTPAARESPPEPAPPAGGARAFLGGLRAAMMLLTRVPVGSRPTSLEARRWAAAWFPVVAAALGLLGAVVLQLGPAGGFLSAVLAVGAVVLVTGALHEDGLADTADALGGATDRERLFAILKDSRIGAYGAVALGLSLLVRVAALERAGSGAAAAFLLAQLLSRLPVVWLMAALPYVTPAAVARSADVARAPRSAALVATALTAGFTAALVRPGWLALPRAAGGAAAAVVVFLLCAWRFRARAGGITGDFLGAAQQLGEAAVLVTVVALA